MDADASMAVANPLNDAEPEPTRSSEPRDEDSWVEADGSCFKLFGGGESEDWKTWPDAEAACQVHGAHLASLASKKQNDAVIGLLAPEEFEFCWIGLTDAAVEGSWVWSDGEPVTYTNWQGGQPNNHKNGPDECAAAEAGQDCTNISPLGWIDTECEAKGLLQGAWVHEDPDRPGCYLTWLPYACSKPAAPAIANGGDMYGCADGHWVLGVAHRSAELPPTLVRRRAFDDAPGD